MKLIFGCFSKRNCDYCNVDSRSISRSVAFRLLCESILNFVRFFPVLRGLIDLTERAENETSIAQSIRQIGANPNLLFHINHSRINIYRPVVIPQRSRQLSTITKNASSAAKNLREAVENIGNNPVTRRRRKGVFLHYYSHQTPWLFHHQSCMLLHVNHMKSL